MTKTLTWALSLAALAAGCSPNLGDACSDDSECASNRCVAGVCISQPPTPDAQRADAAAPAPDASGSVDAAPQPTQDAAPSVPDASTDGAVPTQDAAPSVPDTSVPPADAAAPPADAAPLAQDASAPADGAAPPAPDAALPPPLPPELGACGSALRDALPLWQPDGRPCVTSTTEGLWTFDRPPVGLTPAAAYWGERGRGLMPLRLSEDGPPSESRTRFVEAPFGRALQFDGDYDPPEPYSAYWQGVGMDNFVRSRAPMTVEVWARPRLEPGYSGFAVSNLNDCPSGFQSGESTAGWGVGFTDSGNGDVFPFAVVPGPPNERRDRYLVFNQGFSLPPEDWVYVAFVFEAGMRGESVTAYLNGMPAGQFDIPPLSSMDVYALELGLRVGCWSELFKGDLDGVRILNVALTPEQLALRPDYPTPQN